MLKFLLVVIAIAIVVYACVMLVDRQTNSVRRRPRPSRGSRPSAPRGPIGPDDDPDFLWELNKRNKKPKPDDS